MSWSGSEHFQVNTFQPTLPFLFCTPPPLLDGGEPSKKQILFFNPIALRKAKIEYLLGEGGGGAGQGDVFAGAWEQLFSYLTHSINLIHIALNFHQDIP